MKSYGPTIFVIFLLVIACPLAAFAQATTPAEEAQQLRNELRQLFDRETQIEMRLQELEYELKPENIESYFAGVGSTRPEELRATRRKKLETEKDRLQKQLSDISQDRSRIEAAILNAEVRANYAAAMTNSVQVKQNRMSPLAGLVAGRSRQVAAISVGVILVGLIVAIVRTRRRHITR